MKIRELLSSKDKWTQMAFARNKDGELVFPNSPYAVKWCLIGAILRCYPSEPEKFFQRIEDKIGMLIEEFNDIQSYEKVIELVRELDI